MSWLRNSSLDFSWEVKKSNSEEIFKTSSYVEVILGWEDGSIGKCLPTVQAWGSELDSQNPNKKLCTPYPPLGGIPGAYWLASAAQSVRAQGLLRDTVYETESENMPIINLHGTPRRKLNCGTHSVFTVFS